MKLASRTADFFGYTGSQTESLRHLRAAGFRFGDYSFGCDYNSRSGIYSEDPKKNPNATFYSELTYEDAIRQNLRVMDSEAFAKCAEHNMPIMVFNFREPDNFKKAVQGEHVGTIVRSAKN